MSREHKEQLIISLQKDIERGEGQEIEFKEDYPSNTSALSKEIAAFATSNAGRIYLGVNNGGDIIGISAVRDSGEKRGKDEIQNRLAGLTQKAVNPPIKVTVDFIEINRNENTIVARINVPKGTEPVYYSNSIPYIRNLTSSEPATPDQVKELVTKVTRTSIIRAHAKQVIISESEVKEELGTVWESRRQQTTIVKNQHVLNQFDRDFGGSWIKLGDNTYPKGRNILVVRIEVYDNIMHAREKYSEMKHTYETSPGFAKWRVKTSELGDLGIKFIELENAIHDEHIKGYLFIQNNVLVELMLEWEIIGGTEKLQRKLTPVDEIRFLTLARAQESKIYEFI